MNIKIKPLVWRQIGEKLHWVCKNTLSGHEAVIKVYAGTDYFDLYSDGARGPNNRLPSLVDAKAAAQANHEARILSAIDVDATEAAIRSKVSEIADTLGWRCDGCGRICNDPERDLAILRKSGARSCCPERKMVPLSETFTRLLSLEGTPESRAIAEGEA